MDAAATDARAKRVAEIDRFIAENRVRHLWFLRADYRPATDEERVRALESIERNGDRDSFRRAAELKRWLLRQSNDESVSS